MKIAVASQNKREVTGHTGRCRRFWVYEIDNEAVTNKQLLELTKEQCFHDSSPHDPSPLDQVQVLIAGGMGTGLVRRLEAREIEAIITNEKDPDKAIKEYLKKTLERLPAEPHEHGNRHAHKC